MIIDGRTKIAGVLGHRIGYTLSPAMHNRAFIALGLNIVYLPFDIEPENLTKVVEGLIALGIVGFNVTIPYKDQIRGYLNSFSEDAELIGAVNTVKNENGYLKGYNTDGLGFIISLKEAEVVLAGMKAVLLGTGGAGRAVACMLAKEGVSRLCLTDKVRESANSLKGDIERKFDHIEVVTTSPEYLTGEIKKADIIINATGVGRRPEDHSIIEPQLLRADMVVYDLIYDPWQTPILKNAAEKGAKVLNGLEMLVQQGAAAFEIWTGMPAPVELMRQAALEKL